MDKIYSRKRIQIPKLRRKKQKKIHKMRNLIGLLLLIILTASSLYLYQAYPIFIASCKTAASSRVTHIVNNEVRNVMAQYDYNDLIEVEKDSNGDVVLMQYNTILINQITSQIASNIQNAIDKTPRIMVYINFGSVSRN